MGQEFVGRGNTVSYQRADSLFTDTGDVEKFHNLSLHYLAKKGAKDIARRAIVEMAVITTQTLR